jgi:two-component system sensor histidine kinase MtrB
MEDARIHRGWLEAWGEVGQGSVFRLTLPRTAGGDLAGSPLPLGPDDLELTAGPDAAALSAGAVTVRLVGGALIAGLPDGNAAAAADGASSADGRAANGTAEAASRARDR